MDLSMFLLLGFAVFTALGLLVGIVSIGDLTRWASLTQEVEIQHLVDYITGRQQA